MTCIVGYEQDGRVWIGGDARAMDFQSGDITTLAEPKVWRCAGLLFGHTGGIRGQQALRYGIDWSALNASDLWSQGKIRDSLVVEFLCTVFIRAVIKAYRDFGVTVTRDGVERGEAFLLGFQGKLYEVEDEFAVVRSTRPYAAVGAGRRFALGAMAALEDHVASVEARIGMALQVAADHEASVAGPFTIISSGES